MTADEQQTRCPRCGGRFLAGDRFCPHDGTPLAPGPALRSQPVPVPAPLKSQTALLIGIIMLLGSLAAGSYLWRARHSRPAPMQTVQTEPPPSVPAIAAPPAQPTQPRSESAAPDATPKGVQKDVTTGGEPRAAARPPAVKGPPSATTGAASAPIPKPASKPAATAEPPRAQDATRPSSAAPVEASAASQAATTKVYFATDRNYVAPGVFGSRRGSGLSYGTCVVSIPRDHKLAQIERPQWWNYYDNNNPDKYFVITLRLDASHDGFYSELRRSVTASPSKQALVFVHGFNVAFEDAIYRTAQIAYDLGFDGVPILYTWPAFQGNRLDDYLAALNNNEWTQTHLETVLRDLATDSGATTIHVIGHSMGNRVLAHALANLGKDETLRLRKVLNHVVLTAPDIDADVFRQLAAGVLAAGQHVTLYASRNDKALLLSKQLQGNYLRAGDATTPMILPGIDTIDASAVDTDLIGHSYYGDNRSVLSDLFTLLMRGDPPEKRFGIVRILLAGSNYWAFRP
jgi:esterase/lipase superfamily enzyme